MKILLCSLFIFVLGINVNCQILINDHHHELENILAGKRTSSFLKELGLESSSQELQNILEKEFQSFLNRIKADISNGKKWNAEDLDTAYEKLLSQLQEKYTAQILEDEKKKKGISSKAANGPCTNIDFEDGDLSGWTLTRGEVDGSSAYSFTNETATGPNPHHQIVGNGLDPVTGIPTNNPQGGAYSVQLGDGTGIGAQAARMTQTFLVDSTNFLFTYSYAVIFETPASHNDNELPYFTVRVFDSLGNSIPCGEYSAVANTVTASTYSSTVYNGVTVLYKNWESVFTNLSAYIGQNIQVEFTAGDCSLSGHYGYCYLDAYCGTAELTASNDLICTGDSSLLSAPPGAGSYLWSNGSTTQTTYVYAGGTYTCEITPVQGSGCSVTLSISINETPSPVAAFLVDNSEICIFDSIQYSNTSTIPTPGIIQSYTWIYGDGIATNPGIDTIIGVAQTVGNYLINQHQFISSGTFPTKLIVVSTDGCTDSIEINVIIHAQPIVTTTPNQIVCDGDSVIVSGYGAMNYQWDQGIINNNPFVPTVGNHQYTVVGTDQNGCMDTSTALVQVNPNPSLDPGQNQSLCEGDSTYVFANSPGIITWSNGLVNNVYFTPNLGENNYYVEAEQNGCTTVDSILISVHPLVLLNAGFDTIICSESSADLQASMSNGASSMWFNNQGTFSNPTDLNSSYLPSSNEINQGYALVYITGYSPFGCPSVTDSLQIQINHFSQSYTLQNTDITCFGYADGTANLSLISANNGPFTYALNGLNPSADSFFDSLSPGQQFILVQNSIGCDTVINMEIIEPPILEVQIIEVVDVSCYGSDNGWMESYAFGGNGGYSYGWSNDSTLNTTMNDTLAPGNYTAYAWDQNTCAAQTDTIIIEPQPLANNFDYIPILCFEDSTQLTSVPTGGTAPYNFLWENQETNSSRMVTHGTYEIVVTDANGCFVLDTVALNQPSEIQAQISTDTIVCQNSVIYLVYSANGGTPDYNYTWSNSSVNNDSLSYFASASQYVYCTVADFNGCELADSVFVEIYTVQSSDFGLQTLKDNLCIGDSTQLNYSYTNSTPMSSVFWNDCSSCTFPRMVYPISDTIFSASLVTICYDTIVHDIPLNVIEIPNLSFDLNGGEICPNTPFLLEATGPDPSAWNFHWDLGNGMTSSQSPTWISYANTGTYWVTLTIYDTNGCIYSSDQMDSIVVLPFPIANFEVIPDEKTFLDPTFQFINTSQLASSYQWSFGDNTFAYTENAQHTYLAHGEFYVQLTAYNDLGCSDTIVKSILVKPDFVIYIPNTFTPDADRFNPTFFVEGIGIAEDEFELLIFNRWGEIIFETHDLHGQWDGTYLGRTVLDGTYPWKVNFKDLTGEPHVKVGHVTVLK